MLCVSSTHFSFFPPAAGSCFSCTLGLIVVVDWIVGPAINRWSRLAGIEFEFDKILKKDVTWEKNTFNTYLYCHSEVQTLSNQHEI